MEKCRCGSVKVPQPVVRIDQIKVDRYGVASLLGG